MTDITKCPGTDCDVRDKCYRFTAPDGGDRQSWVEPPTERPCPMFWGYGQQRVMDQLEEIVGK